MDTLRDRSNENRLEKEKGRRKVLAVIASAAAVAVCIFIVYLIWNGVRTKQYTGYTEVDSFARADSNNVEYMYYESGLLKYSRDGAAGIGSDGTALWNGSYEMGNPMVDTCGTYVAVADQGGKEVYVYNGSDDGTVLEMPLPVTMVKVASQGVIAVVLEDSSSNVVALYDPYSSDEKLLVEVPSNVSEDGYPVDIALSADAKSLVTVYLAIRDGVQESNICFYNFSEVGQDKNRIVGGKTYKDSFAIGAEFVGNNSVCIFLDNGFSLFSNMKKPEEAASETFEKEIVSSVYDDGYVGFLFAESEEDASHSLKLYNSSGKTVLEKTVNCEYNKVYMNKGEIIFLSDMSCMILRVNGSEKLNCQFDSPVQYVFRANGKELYYFIDDATITKAKLTEG